MLGILYRHTTRSLWWMCVYGMLMMGLSACSELQFVTGRLRIGATYLQLAGVAYSDDEKVKQHTRHPSSANGLCA